MGYYTDYKIEIQADKMFDADLMDSIKQELISISDYTAWYYGNDEIGLNEAKWYDYHEDMLTLSKRFPDVKFEMHCEGEDGQQWMIYALNGNVERCEGTVVFAERTIW